MPLSTLQAPRLFLLPWLRPNSHLNPLSISCWRRFASVSGRSLGCTLRLGGCCAFLPSFLLSDDREPFFSLLPDGAPLLERHVSVFERKLFWKLAPVGDVLERDADTPVGEALRAGGAVEMGMVEDVVVVGVDVPEDE